MSIYENILSPDVFTDSTESTNDNSTVADIIKSVQKLNGLSEGNYNDQETIRRLTSINNSLIGLSTERVVNDLLKYGLIGVYGKMIKYHLIQLVWNDHAVDVLYRGLNSLIAKSVNTVTKEIIKYDLIRTTMDALGAGDFTSSDNSLYDDNSFNLYMRLASFIRLTSMAVEGRDCLSEIDAKQTLVDHLSQIDKCLEIRKELKYIKIQVIMSLVNLLSGAEMTLLFLTHEFVDCLSDGLRECIQESKTNEIKKNKKYYFTLKIQDTVSYFYALGHLNSLIKMSSINDTIKAKLIESNILEYLEELLENGNDDEKEACCKLLYSLCANDQINLQLVENTRLIKLINKLNQETERGKTKKYSQNLIDMTIVHINNKIIESVYMSKDIMKQIKSISNQTKHHAIFPLPQITTSTVLKTEITEWTGEQVKNWLISNNQNNLVNAFSNTMERR